jgi:hypothetical protein
MAINRTYRGIRSLRLPTWRHPTRYADRPRRVTHVLLVDLAQDIEARTEDAECIGRRDGAGQAAVLPLRQGVT